MEIYRKKLDKGYYWIDNQFDDEYAPVLGWKASAVYSYLCRKANKQQICFPKIETIAASRRIGRDSVIDGLNDLEEWNIIKRVKVRSKNGTFQRNSYILLDKSIWKPLPDRPIILEDTNQVDNTDMEYEIIEDGVDNSDVDTINQVANSDLEPSRSQRLTESVLATNQVAHSDTKDTHHEVTHFEVTPIIPLEGDENVSEVDKLIWLFVKHKINPTIDFRRPRNRRTTEEFIAKLGFNAAYQTCEYAIEIQGRDYAPQIVSPWECSSKLGGLIAYFKKNSPGEQPYFLQETAFNFPELWSECLKNCQRKCHNGWICFREEGIDYERPCECVKDLLERKAQMANTT